jgi:hypothetical protein
MVHQVTFAALPGTAIRFIAAILARRTGRKRAGLDALAGGFHDRGVSRNRE